MLRCGIMLCLKTRSGFERLIFRLVVPMYIGSSIDDKNYIACFSSLGVARDRLCQAKKRSLSHPTTESSDRASLCAVLGESWQFRPGVTGV